MSEPQLTHSYENVGNVVLGFHIIDMLHELETNENFLSEGMKAEQCLILYTKLTEYLDEAKVLVDEAKAKKSAKVFDPKAYFGKFDD